MFADIQQEQVAGVAAQLASDGLARFDQITNRAQLVRLGAALGRIVPHRDSGPDGVTTVMHRGGLAGRAGFQGFSTGALAPHTDRSGVSGPPALLLLACGRKGSSGGECTAIDGRAVYADLLHIDPCAAQALSKPRTVLFGGAAGYLGSIFEHTPGGRVRVRYRQDQLAQFSPELARHLPSLGDAIERHTMWFALEPGEGYVLHNHRWLHGRTAYTGDRVMYRLSVDPHPYLAIPSGFVSPDVVAVGP
ncbi:TauD/TfdA family dioxygenase [Nocardia farcinica]|uniref:TauD/TfdA family dioxygenase n=1 Tax=Nocardia farcinica TaxID=37329 RepID=UPI002457D782|nr:TauD/TfdA family dioxygenase [Nocardia farcinica]